VKEASKYSIPCKIVNTTPKITVKIKPKIVFFVSPVIIALCDQVTVAPELKSMAVFNKGTSKGFNTSIPTGGQTEPNVTSGPNEEWKKAQKNEKKNNTSDVINNIIPIFKPFCTLEV